MVRFIIVILFSVFSYGGKIINISYFPSNDKIDILFSLDEPFKGKILLLSENDYKIDGVYINRIEQKKFKDINIIISAYNKNSVELKMLYKKKLNIQPAITAKGYGLRVRITGFKSGLKTKNSDLLFKNSSSKVQSNDFNIINYLIVIVILIILIIILFIVKKKTMQKLPASLQKDDYKMLYQKMIDTKNKIVLIEIFDEKYLLLMGQNSNILLRRFSDENKTELQDISSQNGFEQLLDEKLDKTYIEKASKLKDLDEI